MYACMITHREMIMVQIHADHVSFRKRTLAALQRFGDLIDADGLKAGIKRSLGSGEISAVSMLVR